MESEMRPHRTKSNSSSTSATSTTTSELFICFTTSRLSSSSMKLSSKSLLSPGRAREPNSQISLSSSLSRRLRTSGSIKGGASPMFPSNGGGTNKKRGCAFENPEPSSPKVTCIGQVRVKTKKQGKKMRIITRSRRSRGSEASFRKTEQNQQSTNAASQSQELFNRDNNFQGLHFQNHQINSNNSNNQQECLRHRNQRWVHLPLTICEALRAFGSEFNCLFPNRSSCLASDHGNNKEKEESKGVRSESGGSSCGAVFARWFVALQDGDGKGREIELVVGEDQERAERSSNSSSGGHSQRRQVFEGIEFKEEKLCKGLVEEEEAGRVSICVPPKNALLLMRCRSDPVKMAALANRFWEMPAAAAPKDDEEGEDEGLEEKTAAQVDVKKEGGEEVAEKLQIGLEEAEIVKEDDGVCEKWVCDGEDQGEFEEAENAENLVLEEKEDENPEERQQLYDEEDQEIEQKNECKQEQLFEEESDVTQQAFSEDCCLLEEVADPERLELEENHHECEVEATHEEEGEEEEEEEVREVKLPMPSMEVIQSEEQEPEEDKQEKAEDEVAEESVEEETETVTQDIPEPDYPITRLDTGSKRAGQNSVLPDCLLLMMCEPKLSMEVSKETWVCTTDFIRCLPERHVKKTDGPDEAKKRVSIDSKPPVAPAQPVIQPPRSSCSFPIQAGPVSMAAMIGQKLVGSTAYEPFVLTRCKSEPMRSAAKLAVAPETCFWKNRKLEPHRRAAMGVGGAGVGF